MKTLLIQSFLLLIGIQLYSQTVAISTTKMNILYEGIDNPIDIVVEGLTCLEYSVMAENGTITDYTENPCSFIYKANKVGMHSTIPY